MVANSIGFSPPELDDDDPVLTSGQEHRLTDHWRDEDLKSSWGDPSRPSLPAIANAGHPFSIPGGGEIRRILCGFESSCLTSPAGPWLDPSSSPFDLRPGTGTPQLNAILPDTKGGNASFRDGFSTHTGSKTEHLSAELGVSVGVPFLAKATVTGKYDRTVIENQNSIQASRNATCRSGRVVLSGTLPFSPEAVMLLRGRNGPARFRKLYGDYYVCGYELGGDAGACLSASSSSTSKAESLALTVTVKVLFVSASVTVKASSSSSTAESKLSLVGYNSIGQKSENITAVSKGTGDEQQAQIKEAAGRYLASVAELPREVRKRMHKLKLRDGQALPLSAVTRICTSGLVVQLLLAPFARLNQYIGLANQPPLHLEIDELPDDPRVAAAVQLLSSA
ncbi:hypothetical protein B0H63DRAFT_445418 [Podospora didyma]|uniref:MACPF domain-containing protein n=1 Tax=Podospora didyma TaxID=330526 RepID=A0AAE0NXE2_9PEZI|nr:hypothetical protein B0H63DRAFT_445418 [Podospora didyma]